MPAESEFKFFLSLLLLLINLASEQMRQIFILETKRSHSVVGVVLFNSTFQSSNKIHDALTIISAIVFGSPLFHVKNNDK